MYDVIIIGAGPAGLMAAVEASKNNKVLIIERNDKPGKKLLLTGNGRCNLTNLKTERDFLDEVSYNKKYLYSAIYKFSPRDIYNYFSNSVPLKEEEENKIFPFSNNSKDILNALLKDLERVEMHFNETVIDIKNGEIKEIITDKTAYKARNIIIATGGASFKETGSKGDHMIFAKKLSQPTIDLFPAETGIYLEYENELVGTALEKVEITFEKKKTYGNLMFTHKGLSGSSIMKMSEHIYLNNGKDIKIDFLPELSKDSILNEILSFDRENNMSIYLNQYFTKRFSNYLLEETTEKKIKSYNTKELETLINNIKEHLFLVKSVCSLDEAYVTGGGIDMKYIDTTTMESKINKGVYFIGEALDIHGPIGGYNLTLAFATGHLAGSSIKSHNN